MRKITTRGDLTKQKKRKQIIVGLILVGVMGFSTIGFAFQNTLGQGPANPRNDNNQEGGNPYFVEYNGYEFILSSQQLGLWILGNGQFGFSYTPNQVERIPGEVNSINSYYGKTLYVSSVSEGAEAEIYRNLDSIILRRQYACLSEENCEENLPVKTCEDNFIIIEEAEISEIVQVNNCVFIRGPQEDLPKLADEFLFKIIGVT